MTQFFTGEGPVSYMKRNSENDRRAAAPFLPYPQDKWGNGYSPPPPTGRNLMVIGFWSHLKLKSTMFNVEFQNPAGTAQWGHEPGPRSCTWATERRDGRRPREWHLQPVRSRAVQRSIFISLVGGGLRRAPVLPVRGPEFWVGIYLLAFINNDDYTCFARHDLV